MNFARPLFSARIVWSAAAITLSGPTASLIQAQQPVVGMDEQDSVKAGAFVAQGKYEEAAALYEKIPVNYPTSPFIPESYFRLGYVGLLSGQYDRGIAALRKCLSTKNVPPIIQERASSLIPQIIAAKAGKLEQDDPTRTIGLQDAVKEFDSFIAKFPQSEEIEYANLGKARAFYSMQKFEDACVPLKLNLTKFPKSPSVLDTQFMLAMVLSTQGSVAMQKATAKDPAADAAYDEAIKYLADIIRKNTDMALSNDAQFQLGEVLSARGSFDKSDAKKGLLKKALLAYRAVQPKDRIVQAQMVRMNAFKQARDNAAKANDPTTMAKMDALLRLEQEKIVALNERADRVLPTKIKVAQIYLGMERYDEVRVLLRSIEDQVQEPDQKKQVAYMIALTYAVQNLTDKAVENFDKFMASYSGDPIAENLPILLGNAFDVHGEPDKAMKYYNLQGELYPNSTLKADSVMRQALALIPLERYDEALAVLSKFIAEKPTKEQGAAAEFGIATIYKKTEKNDQALASFLKVRDTYAGTAQSEQAAYWVGELTYSHKRDAKAAVAEIQKFVTDYPNSVMAPGAMLVLGQAQGASGDKAGALKTLKTVAEKFPKTDAAPSSYFIRASLHQKDGERKDIKAVMKEFIDAYPESADLYKAYDYIAQIQAAEKSPLEAVATYEEFMKKKEADPSNSKALVKISALWKKYAEDQGAYISLKDDQKTEWKKGVDNAISNSERILEKYPESAEVALAMQSLLAGQKFMLAAKLKAEKDLEHYFQDLAKKFEAKPETKNKILFTLAGYLWDKAQNNPIMEDKTRDLMTAAYDPSLVYAPADLDLYGAALLKKKDLGKIQKISEKLATDYPVPAGSTPEKASLLVRDAQSISLYLAAKALQLQPGKTAEAAAKFAELKAAYPTSNKGLEADYGIAEGEFAKKNYDEALKRLEPVVKAILGPPNLRARAMLLIGQINEQKGGKDGIDAAINNYIKVGTLFPAELELAPEGWWRGAQLIEKKMNK